MLKTRTRKIWRDISARKARTFLVSISIFVGVLGVVTLSTVSDLLIKEFQKYRSEDKLAMVTLFWEVDPDVDENTIDQDAVLATIRAYPDVTVAEGWARETLFWRMQEDKGFIEGVMRSFSEPFDTKQIEPTLLIDGQAPISGQKQVMIERRMAESYGLKVGDPLVVRVLSQLEGDPETAGDIPEETWTISGIVFHPYIGDTSSGSVYVNWEDFDYLTGISTFRFMQVRFTDFATADESSDDFRAYVNDNTPYKVGFFGLDDPANSADVKEMKQWTQTLTALAMLAMLVSGFLVVTVISTIVVEQKSQIGIMKSLGATRWDNIAIYTGTAVLYGVLGLIPGILVGIPAGFLLTEAVGGLAGIYVDGFMISVSAVVGGILLGVLVPLIASLLPVFLGTRVSILSALTDLGLSSSFGKGRITRWVGRLPLPMTMRQALANIYQRKGRLAITGFTLTLAVGAFMGVSGLFISINDVIGDIFDTYNYELGVFPIRPTDYDYDAVGKLLKEEVEGVSQVYPAFTRGVEAVTPEMLNDEDAEPYFLFMTGFDPTTDSIKLDLKEGAADFSENGVVLTETVADALDKQVGDTLTVQPVDDPDHRLELRITGIDSFPFETAFVHWQTAAALLDESQADQYWLRFSDPDLTGADVERKTGEIREMLLEHGVLAGFENQRADEEDENETILTIGLVFNIASAVMAAVGAIGLLTMLFISVFERQREIGVMRSVGAASPTIVSLFLVEGLLVGVIAWLLGVPLSYGVSKLLMAALPLDNLEVSYPPMILGVGLVGMLVLATVASLYPSLSAARKTVSEILRYQ